MPELRKIKSSASDRKKAGLAVDKKAAFGSDIELAGFTNTEKDLPYQSDPSALPQQDKAQMLSSGVMLDNPAERSGTFLQMDNTPVHFSSQQEGVEVMATSEALARYDWL